MSILIFFISAGILALPGLFDNNQSTQLPDPFLWQPSTGLTLAENIEDYQDNMLSTSISASVVTTTPDEIMVSCSPDPCDESIFGWGGIPYPLLDHNMSQFSAFYNQETEGWTLRLFGNHPYDPIFSIDERVLENVTGALISDVSGIDNLTQIDINTLDLRSYYAMDSVVIHFSLIYNEGSIVHFEVINSLVLIRFERYTKYISSFTEQGVYIDQAYGELWYMGEISSFFPNYLASLNAVIQLVYGG